MAILIDCEGPVLHGCARHAGAGAGVAILTRPCRAGAALGPVGDQLKIVNAGHVAAILTTLRAGAAVGGGALGEQFLPVAILTDPAGPVLPDQRDDIPTLPTAVAILTDHAGPVLLHEKDQLIVQQPVAILTDP